MTTGLAHLLGKHQLRPEDLDDVFSYVQAASPKWVSHLKMSSTETSAIVNTTGLSDQKDYFQKMLTKWLTLAPPQHPIPTTEALAEAIGKAWSVNLAFKLKKEAMFVGPERVITPENEFLRPYDFTNIANECKTETLQHIDQSDEDPQVAPLAKCAQLLIIYGPTSAVVA
eukprot:Em0002g1647a